MKVKLVQKCFENEGKKIAYVEAVIPTADFGNISLMVKKEDKRVFNFEVKKLGFIVGEVAQIPDKKEVTL